MKLNFPRAIIFYFVLRIIIKSTIIKIIKFLKESPKNCQNKQFYVMIQIKGTNVDNLECYMIKMRQKSFLFVSKPNLNNLKHFTKMEIEKNANKKQPIKISETQMCMIVQQQSQQKKQPVEQPINDLSQLSLHLDLNYIKPILQSLSPHTTSLNLMPTHYQEFLILPYLYRKLKQKHEVKIFCTHIMYEMGRIYLKRFWNYLSRYDLLKTEAKNLSFEEQSKLEDEFYLKFNTDIKTWAKLFKKEDMEEALSKVNKMSYGQIFDGDGVRFRPFPSGFSLGSCFWMFQNALTKQTVVFVKEISNQVWRSISQNYFINSTPQKSKFKQRQIKDIDLLILANSQLITPQKQRPDTQILKLMQTLKQNLEKGANTSVILSDQLLILDIIQYIHYEMKEKFNGIFIENPQFHQIVSYANSYVEFLASQYKEKIYRDPPQYPFEGYLILKQKGFLFAGGLYEACEKQKVPLKQLTRRSTPYLHFMSDYEAILSGIDQSSCLSYSQRSYFSPQDLNSMLTSTTPKKVISFSNILPHISTTAISQQSIAVVQYNKQYSIESQSFNYYTSKNISPNIINKYEFVDGFIMAYPVNKEFLKLGSDWSAQIAKQLKDKFRQVLEVKENYLRTKHTEVWVENFQLFVKSNEVKEVAFILQVLSQITRTLRLL